MARYATGTATDIRPQWDSNPVLTSTSQQVAGMRCTKPLNQLGYHYKATITMELTILEGLSEQGLHTG